MGQVSEGLVTLKVAPKRHQLKQEEVKNATSSRSSQA